MRAIREIAREAGARVRIEMHSFEESCSYGKDVAGAIRLLDEAISDYYDTVLGGTIRELTAEIEAVRAEDGTE